MTPVRDQQKQQPFLLVKPSTDCQDELFEIGRPEA